MDGSGVGEIVANGSGFGFVVEDSVIGRDLFSRCRQVLALCTFAPQAPTPPVNNFRAWQTFVTENLKFRLGVLIGTAIASQLERRY